MPDTTSPRAPTSASRHLKLRGDLKITASDDGSFVFEDPQRGQFFRLGAAEYSVVAQLDGQTDLSVAVRKTNQTQDAQELTTESLQRWLLASGMVESGDDQNQSQLIAARTPTPSRFNVCYFRVSCGAPTRLLTSLEQSLGWLCSKPAAALVVVLSILATFAVIERWHQLTVSLGRVLCPDQHLALLGCWILLKLVHELGHGIACHRFGGDVREWGLAFIYGMPVPYTDVTSSWRCSSRLDRMAVAAAGMYFEWIVALVAVLIACLTTNPTVRQLCMYCVGLATLTTILFNANPLCRLDGYYILTDLIGWPNLAADGQRRLASLWQWRPDAGSNSPAGTQPSTSGFALAYGIAAVLWRQLSLLSMAVVAVLAYEGLGALLIAGVLCTQYWPTSKRPNSPSRTTATGSRVPAYVGLITVGCLLVALTYSLPWPWPVTAPGIVESRELHSVRARSPGHVARLLVEDGQWVDAGQELAELQDPGLAFELARLELTYAQGDARIRSLHTRRQLVDFQVEQQRQETLAGQIAEQRRKLEALTIRAPAAGRVTARRLADLPGSYLAEGAELCTIVEPELEFRFSIAERDLPHFAARISKPLSIRLPWGTLSATLTNLDPHASTELPDAALGANAGGPLPVTPSDSPPESKHPPSEWELLEPRITATATLSAGDKLLWTGQRGSAALASRDRSIAAAIRAWCAQWIDRLRHRAASR